MNQSITIHLSPEELEGLIENLMLKHLGKLKASNGALLSIEEAAALLGIPKNTIYQFTSKRTIPYMKVGRLIKFEEDVLLDWARERNKKTKSQIQNEA